MRESVRSEICPCGHRDGLHDKHGCAAYLGAFRETAHVLAYCPCRRPSGDRLTLHGERRLDERHVVATVRVRERAGSAIAVCELPPALELGAHADDVVDRIKARLRDAFAQQAEPQLVMVVRERDDTSDIRLEALR